MSTTTDYQPTRERILESALALFAQHGYRGTTVGDIEAAAGLAPRSGGLYKHFASKETVLREAADGWIESMSALNEAVELMPLGDLRSELTLMARWGLRQFADNADFLRVIFREGPAFPDLRDRMYERTVREAYRTATAWILRHQAAGALPPGDAEAWATVACSALVAYRIEPLIFGREAGPVDDERFVAAWVELVLASAGGRADNGGKDR